MANGTDNNPVRGAARRLRGLENLTEEEIEQLLTLVGIGARSVLDTRARSAVAAPNLAGGEALGLGTGTQRARFSDITAPRAPVVGLPSGPKINFLGGSPFPVQRGPQMTQAIGNLLVNALEANRQAGNPLGRSVKRILGRRKKGNSGG